MLSDSVGSSETGAQMSHVSVASGEVSTGRFTPLPGTVVVSEELDKVLAPGHDGIGWLAQEGWVPLGYLGDAAKTARTFPVIDGTRYSVPGDRARHQESGDIELLGRDSVTINSGGEKIFAEEVERAIAGHPAVHDVVVVGRPSERWGQEVVALVELSPGAAATAEDIVAHAGGHIARYKLPKDVLFLPAIQRSPAGQGRLPLGEGPGHTRLSDRRRRPASATTTPPNAASPRPTWASGIDESLPVSGSEPEPVPLPEPSAATTLSVSDSDSVVPSGAGPVAVRVWEPSVVSAGMVASSR